MAVFLTSEGPMNGINLSQGRDIGMNHILESGQNPSKAYDTAVGIQHKRTKYLQARDSCFL